MAGIPNDDDIRALCEELERRGFRLDEPPSVLALAQSVPELLDWTDDLCEILGTAEARADALAAQLAAVRELVASLDNRASSNQTGLLDAESVLEDFYDVLAGDAPREQS